MINAAANNFDEGEESNVGRGRGRSSVTIEGENYNIINEMGDLNESIVAASHSKRQATGPNRNGAPLAGQPLSQLKG